MEEKKQKSNMGLGLALIMVGAVLFLIQTDVLSWVNFWPYLIVAGGVLFLAGFMADRKNYGLLMPATILIIVGSLFIYMVDTNWYNMGQLWPTFVLAPGAGFFLMHFLGDKKEGFWIPGLICTTVALVFYSRFWHAMKYIPLVLILVGLYLVVTFFMEKNHHTDDE